MRVSKGCRRTKFTVLLWPKWIMDPDQFRKGIRPPRLNGGGRAEVFSWRAFVADFIDLTHGGSEHRRDAPINHLARLSWLPVTLLSDGVLDCAECGDRFRASLCKMTRDTHALRNVCAPRESKRTPKLTCKMSVRALKPAFRKIVRKKREPPRKEAPIVGISRPSHSTLSYFTSPIERAKNGALSTR